MRAEELIELHRTVGQTFVYVTHDQLEAMTMSDKIAVMRDGVLQQYAAPQEIYTKPANMFVAGFIGTPSMNFLTGELAGRGESAVFRCAAADLAVTTPVGAAAGEKAALGVRPEDVLLGEGPLVATVRLVEPTGYETIVGLDTPAGPLVTRVAADVPLAAGERVPFDLRADRLHLFDLGSEARLDVAFGRASARAAA